MVGICQEGHSQKSAPQKRHKAHLTSAPGKWGSTLEGIRRTAPRESALIKLLVVWASRAGKAQNVTPTESGVPKNLHLSGLGLGSERNSGPTPCRPDWSLSSVDRESTHAVSRGKPSVAGTLASAPHTRQGHLPAAPLPPRSTAEQANLDKRPPPPACVRAEIRHWGDLQTEAK